MIAELITQGKVREYGLSEASAAIIRRFQPEALAANHALVEVVRQIAEGKGITPAQLALAWLLARAEWIIPIPGIRKLHRLRENLGAIDVVLSADEMAELDKQSSTIALQGERYNETMQRLIDR